MGEDGMPNSSQSKRQFNDFENVDPEIISKIKLLD